MANAGCLFSRRWFTSLSRATLPSRPTPRDMRPGFWHKCRVSFRWCRISLWLVVLAALFAIIWFNQIGLPEFLKTRLVATLREHGVELEFSRMRLRFAH